MSILFEAVEPLSQVIHHFNRYDEDAIDRLNHKYSTVILCILAIVVTTSQYVGERIQCWAPAEFPDHWVEYVNSICWTSNTYFIPMKELDVVTSQRKEIVYYQWVPLVLFTQAFFFYLPFVMWHVLNRSIGHNINKVAQALRMVDQVNPEARDSSSKFIVHHVERAFDYTRNFRTNRCSKFKEWMASCGCLCGKRYGNFLTVSYLFTKVLYIINSLMQLYLMKHFLDTEYLLYGVEVVKELSTSGQYSESRRFPRVTLCDFTVRSIAKNHHLTVQCTLPINLFNEKIFIFVWFWLALVIILNCLSLLYWLWIAFNTNRKSFIKTYLSVFKRYDKQKDNRKLNYFCNQYIRHDGHFLLRMIGKNTNDVIVAELVRLLWENFGKKYEKIMRRHEV
mgnify:CR=1 FL=1